MANKPATRINKYLSEVGYCSRREADKLLKRGRVTVNGEIPPVGYKVRGGELVEVNGRPVQAAPAQRTILAFNKPVGIVCTTDAKNEKDNIIDFIKYPRRIFPIGRLDKDSEGLIFLTDDGDIVNKILRAGNNHQKEYLVSVNKPITGKFLHKMRRGVPVLGQVTKKCIVEKCGEVTFRIVLVQGLNRQIRRMCEALGYKVKVLQRIRIMNIELDVPVGEYRELTEWELADLKELTQDSSMNQAD